MSEFKVGDKLVLRPKTKPYTFRSQRGNPKVVEELKDNEIYKVSYTHSDGDVSIVCDGKYHSNISPHHLKHAEQTKKVKGEFSDFQLRVIPRNYIDNTELRLSIFNAKPNRTLEEMQAIEDWLLGEK